MVGKELVAMPILDREIDLYPNDLLERSVSVLSGSTEPDEGGLNWYAMYTLARYEKKLMRQLLDRQIGYYAPVIAKRYRSAGGRIRTSYIPLFSNYVFVAGTEEDRYNAVSTGSISRWLPVKDPSRLITDLRQIRDLIATGAPITPEARLDAGDKVRVRTGPFAGFYGVVTKRQGETKLLVYVDFMGQGASVNLEDCQLDPWE
jgi:transcription antitermination factor NusG